jgi:hypothetical protein
VTHERSKVRPSPAWNLLLLIPLPLGVHAFATHNGKEMIAFQIAFNVALAALVGLGLNFTIRHLRRVREVRARGGRLCPECGFELTGLVEGACPECGRPFSIPAEPAFTHDQLGKK